MNKLKVDLYGENGGLVTVNGWAVFENRPAEVVVLDEKGNRLPSETVVKDRKDVSKLLFGDESCVNCGFELSFSRGDGDTFEVRLKDEPEKKGIRFSLTGYTPYWRYKEPRTAVTGLLHQPAKMLRAIKKEGLTRYVKEECQGLYRDQYGYEKFRKAHAPSHKLQQIQKNALFTYMPTISLVMPAYRTPIPYLKELFDSIYAQTYSRWELCVADGSAPETEVSEFLKNQSILDDRVKFVTLSENKGISENTNAALKLATGEFVALLDHDDLLAENALFEIVKALNQDRTIDCLYTDEDKVHGSDHLFYGPTLKPDYDRELLQSINYICHLYCVRREIVEKVGPFDPSCDGSQDYDFILRTTALARKIHHIPKVLYHWRSHPASTAQSARNKMYCYEAAAKAINRDMKKSGLSSEVFVGAWLYKYDRFFAALPEEKKPLISVVLWGKLTREKVKKTKESILNASGYGKDHYEFLYGKGAVSTAEGEYLFFIKAGAELVPFEESTTEGDHISEKEIGRESFPYNLLGHLQKKDVAMAGARITDRDNRIVFAGTVKDKACGVDFPFYLNDADTTTGFYDLLKDCTRAVSGLSLSGLMIKKEIFNALGGLNEERYGALSATGLSYAALSEGYRLIFEPTVRVRLSGLAPKDDPAVRSSKEAARLARDYKKLLETPDPFLNPNLILHMGKLMLRG